MTLTKQQKLEAYTYCLLAYLSGTDLFFLSPTLHQWMIKRNITKINSVWRFFPELIGQIPLNTKSNDLLTQRLRAIERAIELTEKLSE